MHRIVKNRICNNLCYLLGVFSHKLNMCDSTWLIFWIGKEMKEQNSKYLSRKNPPLRNLKMLEGQPMVEPFKVIPSSYFKWMPPRFDNLKVYICFINCFGILIVVVDFHVFCLPLSQLNKPISVNFHGLNPMEKGSSFFVVQWLGGLSWWTKHNALVEKLLFAINCL